MSDLVCVLEVLQDSKLEKEIGYARKTPDSYNQIAKKYPNNVNFVSKLDSPSWGESWWVADAAGYIKLYKSNWDSSD